MVRATALRSRALSLEKAFPFNHASGKRDSRPGLDARTKALRVGDTLVIWKLDGLGRDLRHLVNTVHDLTKRGVGLKVLAGQGANIDDSRQRAPRVWHLRRSC